MITKMKYKYINLNTNNVLCYLENRILASNKEETCCKGTVDHMSTHSHISHFID